MSIIAAPDRGNISLDRLFNDYILKLVIPPNSVKEFHDHLVQYLYEDANAVYLIRQMQKTQRGLEYKNNLGLKIRQTDNAPSWWLHHYLFFNRINEFKNFKSLMTHIPCHMFDIRLKKTINKAGWHVAHIYDVKDYNMDHMSWGKEELIKRTIRNIHPCNYFYVPKSNWQKIGGDMNVINFFRKKFKELYASVWSDFEKLAHVEPIKQLEDKNDEVPILNLNPEIQNSVPPKPTMKNTSYVHSKNKIVSTRLMFKANVIEPLKENESFEIHCPDGVFKMSKKEFYHTFENVVLSKSYGENGLYHYVVTPKKAYQFLIR